MTIMVDGINLDVPAIHARYPSNPVACYVNGLYAWSPAQEHLFARKIRVSVEPGQPTAARYARCLDVERGAARPFDVAPFLAERAKIGSDGTVYCSLSTVPQVLQQLPEYVDFMPRWWLAWYWGGPSNSQPTAGRVLGELHALTGVTLPPERLWACQYASFAQWDLSVVYGPEDFSR